MTDAPVSPIRRSATGWGIDDDLVHLRVFGTEQCYLLTPGASPPTCYPILGSRYAQLEHRDGRWLIRDLEERNRVRVDDVPCCLAVLEPGTTINLNGVTLIAESARVMALRHYLQRLLGFGDAHATSVDQALRAIRLAIIQRHALVVSAAECAYDFVHVIHKFAVGAWRPFVTGDLYHSRVRECERAVTRVSGPPVLGGAMQALVAAERGTLCYWGGRMPDDLPRAMQALREPTACTLLALCGLPNSRLHIGGPSIDIPPLIHRGNDLPKIVDAYAADAIAELGAVADSYVAEDRDLTMRIATTYVDVARVVRRLIAIRDTGSQTLAARRLRITYNSLRQWMKLHRIPPYHVRRGRRSSEQASAPSMSKEVP